MAYLKRPFQLGSLLLPSNVFCAPLAGCSDYPFRQMTSAFRPGLVFCEMVKMDALIRNDPNTYRLLDFSGDMHPIGAQICGSKPQIAGQCAKIVEDLGFDLVDLNCGCPVDKITKDGSGSGMLKTPLLIGEIVANMVQAVKIPVTVKIRAGWDSDQINAPQITKIVEEAGATAICIHGRTRAQAYRGPANWDYIKACKEVAKKMVVIGNGDIFSGESARKIFQHTGCDAILVSRGTMGQPWIVEEIYRELASLPSSQHTPLDYRDTLLQHLSYVKTYHPDRKGAMDMRRIGCWYLKKGKGTRQLREALNRSRTLGEVEKVILDYDWAATDFDPQNNPQEEEIIECEVK